MIRLWLSRHGSVPVKDQLSAQLLLGILSKRLPPGERLPSVRELARRLHVHANTVSAVYQDLSSRGWVEARHGSGVFVAHPERHPTGDGLASFVKRWVEEGSARGFSIEALRSEFDRLAARPKTVHLAVADPDIELARILAAEISDFVGAAVGAIDVKDAALSAERGMSVLVSSGYLPVAGVAEFTPVCAIQINSVQDMVAGTARPGKPVLIAIVSRSQSVLAWATPLLSALGFPPEAIVLRNPCTPGWGAGLTACDIVAADVCTSAELPPGIASVGFRLVSDESLAAISKLLRQPV